MRQARMPALRPARRSRGRSRRAREVLDEVLRALVPRGVRGGLPAHALGRRPAQLPLRAPLLLPLRALGGLRGDGAVQPLPCRVPRQARRLPGKRWVSVHRARTPQCHTY